MPLTPADIEKRRKAFRVVHERTKTENAWKARVASLPPGRQRLATLRRTIDNATDFPRTPDKAIRREKPPGWMTPYLLQIDTFTWGRWEYWCQMAETQKLPDEPIPQIDFLDHPHPKTLKMLERCLDICSGIGEWRTMGKTTYVEYLLDWILYAFGVQKELPKPPKSSGGYDTFSMLYQVFCLDALIAYPYDYIGYLMADTSIGKQWDFYPTPICLTNLMARMLHGEPGETDRRLETVCDPCVGTGRTLLLASNHSLRLSGQDINHLCVKATLVNFWLYAPWGAKALSFLDKCQPPSKSKQSQPTSPPNKTAPKASSDSSTTKRKNGSHSSAQIMPA